MIRDVSDRRFPARATVKSKIKTTIGEGPPPNELRRIMERLAEQGDIRGQI